MSPALDSAPNLCSSPLQLGRGARLDAALHCPCSPASVSPLQLKAVRKGNSWN